jgi:hypothetical protein
MTYNLANHPIVERGGAYCPPSVTGGPARFTRDQAVEVIGLFCYRRFPFTGSEGCDYTYRSRNGDPSAEGRTWVYYQPDPSTDANPIHRDDNLWAFQLQCPLATDGCEPDPHPTYDESAWRYETCMDAFLPAIDACKSGLQR